MSALTDFHEPMRILLGDHDPQQFEFEDAMLDAMLRCAYHIGAWPAGYVLTGHLIAPEVKVGTDYCQILMESLLAGVVGQQGAYSFKTRAISETDHGERKRDILQYARLKLYELRDGSAVFSSRQSLIAFLNTIEGIGDLAGVNVVPGLPLVPGYTIDFPTGNGIAPVI